MINLPSSSFQAIAPEIILVLGALFILVLDLFLTRERHHYLQYFSLAFIALAGWYTAQLWGDTGFHFYDMIIVDNFRLSIAYTILIAAGMTILMSGPYIKREEVDLGEYYCLTLLATVGMLFMAAAADLIMIFVSLETMSIGVYILAAFQRYRVASNEAGLKYLLIGSFATSFLLYGIALVYAATGHTDLDGISRFLTNNPPAGDKILYAGIAMLVVGFGFKVAAFPFHLWTPDVYEGAPTSITAFMAAGVKVAAFAAFARVFMSALHPVHDQWAPALYWLAILTMSLGNLVAVTQTNIKRLLAYSSIAHAGYLLIGITAGTSEAASAMVFYLAAYTLMTMGVFAVVIYLGHKGEPNLTLYDFAGLGYRYPLLGFAMVVLMMSLAGLPPTAGFMAKFYLFRAAIREDLVWLVVIAVLNSVVSVYYYLGILVRMFMNPPEEEGRALPAYVPVGVTLAVSIAGIILLGIFPTPWIDAAQRSVMVALGMR
ncbi:MAG: NADH-quinone oxidoreductase subunit N [Armatimonadetes bacterium]|nr:NADH-quinone oxidoreductase subunit N [Armatimonadota bacterium]